MLGSVQGLVLITTIFTMVGGRVVYYAESMFG